jgi:hypothetical protein
MFPKGKWKAEGFDRAQCPQETTVLLLLGVPDEEFVISWLKMAVARRPRLIMLEVHQRRDQPGEKPWQRIFARASRHVSSKEYVKMDSGFYPWSYESKGERYDSERYFEIWKLKSHF